MANMDGFGIVVGITGLIAAGKDTLADLLQVNGFVCRRTSDAIRAEAKRRGIADPTREQLQDLGNEGRRVSGDGGYWQRMLLADAANAGISRLVLNGIRNPAEINALRETLGGKFTLPGIVADFDIRFERYNARRQAGDILDKEAFRRIDARDRGLGEPDDGQQVDRCLAMVSPEHLYDNSGELTAFERWFAADFLPRL